MMAIVLADTNLWLRAVDPESEQHEVAFMALGMLASAGHAVHLAPQVLTEFWVVATRPKDVNGLGWSTEKTWMEIRQMSDSFPTLLEPPQTWALWLDLVRRHEVKGKRAHDAKLVALLEAHRATHLLTFNTGDFASFPNVVALDPAKMAAGEIILSD